MSSLRHLFSLLVFPFIAASTAHAVIDYKASERAKTGRAALAPAHAAIDVNALFPVSGEQAKSQKPLTLELPSGERYEMQSVRVLPGLDGARTFVGSLKSHGPAYEVFITEYKGAVSGVVRTPQADLDIKPHPSLLANEVIVSTRTGANSRRAVYFKPDAIPTPVATARMELNKALGGVGLSPEYFEQAQTQAKAGNDVVVDILVAYTPGMTTRHSTAAGVLSRINTLVALMNNAMVNSQVTLTIRLVHATSVSYSDTASNDVALTDISPGSTAAIKTTLDNLRNQYGADLVTLVRPYSQATHDGCGLAWILGSGAGSISVAGEAPYGFSVASDGDDVAGVVNGVTYYCDDRTFAHELGHNFGLHHDRANASGGAGVTDYAYGYISGATGFGTIMSYASNRVTYYSNPNVQCNGVACGVARTDTTNSADNAGALMVTMASVAAFRNTVVSSGVCPAPGLPVAATNSTATRPSPVTPGAPTTPNAGASIAPPPHNPGATPVSPYPPPNPVIRTC